MNTLNDLKEWAAGLEKEGHTTGPILRRYAETWEAEVAALREDKERLDWLAFNPDYINLDNYDEDPDALRVAIDTYLKKPLTRLPEAP